jgi:plexin A
MVALHARLDYITYIMTRLLCNLMKRPQIKTSPQLFLRRTESIAEKFLTNWLTFCLYDYVKQNAGNPLFVLYRAIKTQIESGPVDMVTYEARYALSEDKLLRQKVEFVPLNVYLSVEGGKVPVKLLDCDTITQAKHKLQDAWYKGCAVSRRVSVDTLDLRLIGFNNDNGMTLRDDDGSNKCEGDWKRLNTLRHYKVCDGAVFSFRKIETPATNKFGHLLDGSSVHFNSNPKLNRSYDMNSSKMSRRGSGSSCEYRTWHLSKNTGHNNTMEGGETKFMPEIYLTRLLTTKGTLQTFVDDLFNSIFRLSNGDVPPAIKFLFDLLDRQAAENGITDPDIIHTWKNNSIPLRFWINIIKNPEMILDVEKTPIIDSFLSVVAQTYMDACSLSDHRFNPDTPSSKLLYAAELREYKQSVQKFYADIQALPPVTDEKLYSSLPNTSKQSVHLNRDAALFDLAVYANTYCYQVDEALAANHYDELSKKFASVISHLQVFLIPST